MNTKQERFAREYVVDHNATQAAIRAGYSKNSAHVNGPRLLTNAEVQELVASLDESATEAVGLTTEWILNGLMQIAESGKTDSARVRAFELLGKHRGLFVDKVDTRRRH